MTVSVTTHRQSKKKGNGVKDIISLNNELSILANGTYIHYSLCHRH